MKNENFLRRTATQKTEKRSPGGYTDIITIINSKILNEWIVRRIYVRTVLINNNGKGVDRCRNSTQINFSRDVYICMYQFCLGRDK